STRTARRRARESDRRRRALGPVSGVAEEENPEVVGDARAEVILNRSVPLDEVGEAEALRAATLSRTQGWVPGSLEELSGLGERKDLADAMSRLDNRHRRVLTLLYFHELTLEEVGEQLGLSASRVCQLRGEALAELRSTLAE
ncbi:MAG: sigma-70 family RNA polymerase sigma factor, partial [Myxococcota bacterium]